MAFASMLSFLVLAVSGPVSCLIVAMAFIPASPLVSEQSGPLVPDRLSQGGRPGGWARERVGGLRQHHNDIMPVH